MELNWNYIGIFLAFIVYFGLMIYIGFRYYNKTSTVSDYILGGRGLHKWVTALSAEASDMSGWLLLGLPGLAYLTGLSEAGWVAIGLIIGTYLNWRFVAKRLRIYTQSASDSLTIPEFFKNRLGDNKAILSAISSVFILIFFLVYTSSQFVAGGKLFNSVFGIDYTVSMFVCALIVVIYTFMGGFRGVCLTDFIQGLLMLFALLIVPFVAVMMLMDGGTSLSSINPLMLSLFHDPLTGDYISLVVIVSGLAWAIGYFGQPHILIRFMAINDPEEIPQARRFAMVWVILSLVAAISIGLIGQIFFQSAPLAGPEAETVFIKMTTTTMFSFAAGIVYCGILGAIMSTASSQLLVAASAISQDMYKAIIDKNASDKRLLIISRMTVLIISALSITLALDPNSSVFGIVSLAWAGFGSTFAPVILMTLFWRRTNIPGTIAGIVAGGLTVLIWYYKLAAVTGVYEIIPGFFVGIVTIYIVSKLTSEPDKHILDEYDSYKKSVKNGRM